MLESQKYKLQELLYYLNENNQHFQKLFNEKNIDLGGDIEFIFSKLPLSSKQDIRSNLDTYISNSGENIITELTSGSTGIPLKCPKTPREILLGNKLLFKERGKWDDKVNTKNFISLYGNKTYKEIGDFFLFEKKNMITCFNRLMNFSPRWICGPITTIRRYVDLIKEGTVKYNDCIRYIELAGEYVEEKQRQYIEKIMNCKTINHYGLRESWCIAYECIVGRLHVIDEHFYIENVKLRNGSKYSELIITSLYHKTMPLIRYQTGDYGKIEFMNCKCGKNSTVLTLMGGRVSDTIKGKKEMAGDIVFKRIINNIILAGQNFIDNYSVEQIKEHTFIFYIVKDKHYSENTTNILIEKTKQMLGKETEVIVKYVDNIYPQPSGKAKIFKSYENIN